MEVARPSILNILNQQMEQMPMGRQTSRTVFHNRHKSLNEAARRQEERRIDIENHKLLLKMNNLKPSSVLQVK
jgi:hypothetical protein